VLALVPTLVPVACADDAGAAGGDSVVALAARGDTGAAETSVVDIRSAGFICRARTLPEVLRYAARAPLQEVCCGCRLRSAPSQPAVWDRSQTRRGTMHACRAPRELHVEA